jgi:ABC-type transport system involved in cytochrome c biogenesis permease subunit
VFVGFASVLLGLVLEGIYRGGFGNLIVGVTGFSTLWIAHFLAARGDTFVVLQAVLDTQFWLATHVVCITLGYATTYTAGMLGVAGVIFPLVSAKFTAQTAKELSRMLYGMLCFSIFFSFVGTVLGGLWADDSWGRFWGWDPKENGALMIVLWNALVLHARWGGMVGDRGLAVLAVAGNIFVSWSGFGVNELGIGLHSYGGSGKGGRIALAAFIGSQLLIMSLALLPRRKPAAPATV